MVLWPLTLAIVYAVGTVLTEALSVVSLTIRYVINRYLCQTSVIFMIAGIVVQTECVLSALLPNIVTVDREIRLNYLSCLLTYEHKLLVPSQ